MNEPSSAAGGWSGGGGAEKFWGGDWPDDARLEARAADARAMRSEY